MKLTFHDACWDAAASPWADQALHAGVRWLKVIDDPPRAYAVATTFQKCQVIYRKVAPQDIEQLSDLRRHPEFGNTVACAQMFVRLADIRPLPNLWIEGANEIRLNSVDDAQWYGNVEAIRSMLLRDRGLKAVIGNFATGNPTEVLFFHFMNAYTAAGGDTSALIGLHEYGAINVPAAQDNHNLLRHRKLRGYATGYRWAITECGLDKIQVGGQWVGGGWRAGNVSQADYWRFLLDFNNELEKDSDVVCAAVFTYGDTARWKDYEMQDAKEFNGELVSAISADGQQTMPSAPATESPLLAFDGASKSVVLHVGRAGKPLLPRIANYTIHVYEIVDGWWRVTPRTVNYWMQAIPLRAS